MAQFARPSGDEATGGWSSTPLWSKIDNGQPGDTETIESDDNTSPDNADFTTTDVTDPQSSSNHIMRVRWSRNQSAGHNIDGVFELWQGVPGTGTLIASIVNTAPSTSLSVDSHTLSAAEADAITDYANLYLRLSRQGETGGNPNGRRSLVVDYAELEVPDAVVSDDLLADNLTSGTPALSSVSLGQTHGLDATDLSTTPTLASPSVGQEHGLDATDLASGMPTIGTPAVAEVVALSADDLSAGTPTLTVAAVGQAHALSSTDVTATPVLDSPAVGQAHVFTATDLSTTPTLGNPALSSEGAVLGGVNVTAGTPTLGAPAVGQEHVLSIAGLLAGAPALGAPALNRVGAPPVKTVDLGACGMRVPGVPSSPKRKHPPERMVIMNRYIAG